MLKFYGRVLLSYGEILLDRGMRWEAFQVLSKSHELTDSEKASRLISRIEDPPFPETVSIEVSTVCNLRCPLCLNEAGLLERSGKFMSLEQFREIFDQVRPSTKFLILVGQGETFLNSCPATIRGPAKTGSHATKAQMAMTFK